MSSSEVPRIKVTKCSDVNFKDKSTDPKSVADEMFSSLKEKWGISPGIRRSLTDLRGTGGKERQSSGQSSDSKRFLTKVASVDEDNNIRPRIRERSSSFSVTSTLSNSTYHDTDPANKARNVLLAKRREKQLITTNNVGEMMKAETILDILEGREYKDSDSITSIDYLTTSGSRGGSGPNSRRGSFSQSVNYLSRSNSGIQTCGLLPDINTNRLSRSRSQDKVEHIRLGLDQEHKSSNMLHVDGGVHRRCKSADGRPKLRPRSNSFSVMGSKESNINLSGELCISNLSAFFNKQSINTYKHDGPIGKGRIEKPKAMVFNRPCGCKSHAHLNCTSHTKN